MIYAVLTELRDRGFTTTIAPHNRMWCVTLSREQSGEHVSAISRKVFAALSDAMQQLEDEDLRDFISNLGRRSGVVRSEAKSRANQENGRRGAQARWARA